MSSRAVDMAAMGFKVSVNGFQIPVYKFEQYVALLTEEPVDDQPDQVASTCPPKKTVVISGSSQLLRLLKASSSITALSMASEPLTENTSNM